MTVKRPPPSFFLESSSLSMGAVDVETAETRQLQFPGPHSPVDLLGDSAR